MKKALLAVVAALMAVNLMAEPRAIGVRIGADAEFSYQHYLGMDDNFIQIDVGVNGWKGFGGVVTYNWQLDFATNWYLNLGFGVGAGYDWYKSKEWKIDTSVEDPVTGITTHDHIWSEGKATYLGLAGQAALEYQLPSMPLAVDFSWRPIFGPMFGDYLPAGKSAKDKEWAYFKRGLWDFSLGVRYVF